MAAILQERPIGSLAEVCADNPGAFLGTDVARAEATLDPADLAAMERALADLGYVRERLRGTTGERLRGPKCVGALRRTAHLVDTVLRPRVIPSHGGHLSRRRAGPRQDLAGRLNAIRLDGLTA